MNPEQYDRFIYEEARKFLLAQEVAGLDAALLDKYLQPPAARTHINSVPQIYERLLMSMQSGNMKAGVIGGSIGTVQRLGTVLDRFNPTAVVANYGEDWERLLDDIVEQLQPRGQIRRTPRSIWPQYCKSVLSAAAFMTQFTTSSDFFIWVDRFDGDDRARLALPLLLEVEIYGLGFPLACDFLKELGYRNFAKPDVHIRDIFTALALCPPKANNYQIFKAIVRVAHNCSRTPYDIDKLFWLVGSGFFYDDPQVGKNGRIGSLKRPFIAHIQSDSLFQMV